MKLTPLVTLLFAGATSLSATEPLSIRVSPLRAFAPANLQVVVRISPDANNRSLAIVADSTNFYRRSEVPLDGDRAPRWLQVSFPGVPGGEYRVTAALISGHGEPRAIVHREVVVLPPGL